MATGVGTYRENPLSGEAWRHISGVADLHLWRQPLAHALTEGGLSPGAPSHPVRRELALRVCAGGHERTSGRGRLERGPGDGRRADIGRDRGAAYRELVRDTELEDDCIRKKSRCAWAAGRVLSRNQRPIIVDGCLRLGPGTPEARRGQAAMWSKIRPELR